MTAQESLKRNEKSQWLKVWQVDDTWFYVESEDGKIAYKCCISDQGDCCNCGDFATRSKNDPQFKCKHILAVMNSIPRNEVLEAHFLDKRKPKLDESFIKEIDDKDFVLYGGLLDCAHQKNLCMVDVDLIQFPSDENKQTAICKAVVQTIDGKKFSDIGDANPINCNSKVAKHLIRMASTRAKARAFRDMDNIGMTCLEELGISMMSSPMNRRKRFKKGTMSNRSLQNRLRQLNQGMVTGGNPKMKFQYPVMKRVKWLCNRIRLYNLLRKNRQRRQRLKERIQNLEKYLKSQ